MNTQTFNISLPKDLVKRVDRAAKKEYKNRSEFIREALRIYIIKAEEKNRIIALSTNTPRESCVMKKSENGKK